MSEEQQTDRHRLDHRLGQVVTALVALVLAGWVGWSVAGGASVLTSVIGAAIVFVVVMLPLSLLVSWVSQVLTR